MVSNTAEHRLAVLGSIQIVHIKGSRQGEIEHFLPGSLSFGRHPSCDIVFPRDELTVSRVHARLECDERECRLIGIGGNGTYVNGKLVDNTALRTGDVVTFSEHGPKLSFIFQAEGQAKLNDKTSLPNHIEQDATSLLNQIKDITPPPGLLAGMLGANPANTPGQSEEPVFTLHFENELRSFKKSRIYVGRGPGADFIIDHPRILDQHALFYFSASQCVVANTTALKLIWLNHDILRDDTPLQINDIITLNRGGPSLIYKGDGKFQRYSEEQENSIFPTIRNSADNQNYADRLGALPRQIFNLLFNLLKK